MFKKFITAIAVMAGLTMASGASADNVYNSVATAYVTTNISQDVVFDSTMQQGGTFTFSVLAHNGGGRAGQSDTANVSITFYNAQGQQISTVSSNYSNNLPNPNALGGNPQADPSVPWTTLTVSSTNCGGSCANVAYAVVKMTGIDGSYWAGDYGPWYRAPTFTLNGGGNMVYNPEFGPYNGTNVQGWSVSPALGACQGAWGGSNACIVNNQGVPGSNTVGLVANQNGGGPSATGGTTNGAAGGYNSSMSVSSPNGAPAATTSTNTLGTTVTATLGQSTDTSITNNGTINTSGTDMGISATSASTTAITNAGTITTNNGTGISSVQGTSTTASVTVNNSGTINANTSGTATNGSSAAQGIVVQFSGTGSTGTATINNTSTGSITTTNGDSIVMMGYGNNILNNDGSITTTLTGTNSMPGVLMGNTAIINNNGTITGDVGVDYVSALTGSNINNLATGTITGNSGLAIIELGTTTGASVNNFGIINGDVQLSTNGTYNLVGNSSQVGAIRTTDATGSTNVNIGVSVAPTNATLQGNIGDLANTSAPIGTYGNFPRAFTFQTIGNVTIDATSSLTDNTGYTISANTVTNNGTFVSGAGTTTINGAFVNNGVFSTTFNGPSYSQVAVNGAMTIGSNATYVPIIAGNSINNITLNSPYTSIVSATGGISGAFVATSGSIGNLNWAVTQNGNQIDMLWTPQVFITGTSPGTPVVVNTTTDGTPTSTSTTSTYNVTTTDANGNTIVTTYQTVTTTVTTPETTTTTTTPVTVTTYNNGTTTTTNGAPTTSTNNTNIVTTTTSQPVTTLVATTSPSQPIVTSSSVNGTTTSVQTVVDGTPTQTATIATGATTETHATAFNTNHSGTNINVARTDTTTDSTPYTTTVVTSTPVTTTTTNTTPVTTTTVTTPTFVTTYSDGSASTTTDGTSTSSTSTTDAVTVSTANSTQVTTSTSSGTQVIATPVTRTASASITGLQDSVDYQNSNLYMIDPFFQDNGSWATPSYTFSKTAAGNIGGEGISFGHQGVGEGGIVWGVAGYYGQTSSNGYNNSSSSAINGSGTAYVLADIGNGKVKASVGFANTDHTNTISLPTIGIGNQQKLNQKNVYADIAYYTPFDILGWTPFVGVTVNDSTISDSGNSGSAVLAQPTNTGSTVKTTPYAGAQIKINDNIALQGKVSNTDEHGVVGSGKVIVKKKIMDNTSLYLSASYDHGNSYDNGTVMVGLTVDF